MQVAGFLIGVAMLLVNVIPIALVILGSERVGDLVYPPFLPYFIGVAMGLCLT